jgi:hypothetical protein
MLIKWVLIAFVVLSAALFVLSKLLAWVNPPRPSQPRPAALRRVERALRWSVLVPAGLALALLAFTLLRAG